MRHHDTLILQSPFQPSLFLFAGHQAALKPSSEAAVYTCVYIYYTHITIYYIYIYTMYDINVTKHPLSPDTTPCKHTAVTPIGAEKQHGLFMEQVLMGLLSDGSNRPNTSPNQVQWPPRGNGRHRSSTCHVEASLPDRSDLPVEEIHSEHVPAPDLDGCSVANNWDVGHDSGAKT